MLAAKLACCLKDLWLHLKYVSAVCVWLIMDRLLHKCNGNRPMGYWWVADELLTKISEISLLARFMGPIWGPSGPTGPRWAPCWPHELCYLGLPVIVFTHWGRVTHICFSKITIIGSENGLPSSHNLNQCLNIVNSKLKNKRQWTIKRHLKMSYAKWRQFCHGLKV